MANLAQNWEWIALAILSLSLILITWQGWLTRQTQFITPDASATITPQISPTFSHRLDTRSTLPPRDSWHTTLAPGLWLTEANPPPDLVQIEPPSCYSGINQTQLCLGRVWNTSEYTVSHLQLTYHNTPIAIQQNTLHPRQSAPYHLLISMAEAASPITYDSAHLHTDTPQTPITIHQQIIDHIDDGLANITLELSHLQPRPLAAQIIVIVSYQDQLTGYRVQTITLPDKRRTTHQLQIASQVQHPDLHYDITIQSP